MKIKKLLIRASSNPAALSFSELQRLLVAAGFVLARTSGSHHIYRRSGVPELINIQNDKGMAKAYQVRQFLKIIEQYNIRLED